MFISWKNKRRSRYDYSRDNHYFITMVVDNHSCDFGEVHDGKMYLNQYGYIAEYQLIWLTNQYPYVLIPSSIVMPNHVHLILTIDRNLLTVGAARERHAENNERHADIKIKPISELVGAYKTTTSKTIHLGGDSQFRWQRSYYDHIINDASDFNRICKYIKDNPLNWDSDLY